MRAKAFLPVVVVVTALSLTACGPDDPAAPGAAAGSATTGVPGGPASAATTGAPVAAGRDGCLTGAWKVDVNDLARQTAAKVGRGATGSGSGTLTLTFGDEMTIKYNNVIAIKTTVGQGMTMVMKDTFTGSATSTDWVAKDGKLAGTMPTNTVKSNIVTSINGQETPATSIPFDGALDMSAGALGYTCSGNTATFTTPMVTWHLSKI